MPTSYICHLSLLTPSHTHTITCSNKPACNGVCTCTQLHVCVGDLRVSLQSSFCGHLSGPHNELLLASYSWPLAGQTQQYLNSMAGCLPFLRRGREGQRHGKYSQTDGQLQENRGCYHRQIQADSFFTSHPEAIHTVERCGLSISTGVVARGCYYS